MSWHGALRYVSLYQLVLSYPVRLAHDVQEEDMLIPKLICVLQLRQGTPTSERAVPVAIFSTEPAIARAFLRKWCGDMCEGAHPSATWCCSYDGLFPLPQSQHELRHADMR